MNTFEKIWQTLIDSFTEWGQSIAAYIPNLIAAIIVLLVGFFIAKVLRNIITKVLSKVGLDAMCDRIKITDSLHSIGIKIEPTKLLATIVYYFVLIVFIKTAATVAEMTSINNAIDAFFAYLPKLVVALIIFVIGVLISSKVKESIHSSLYSIGISGARVISNMAFYGLLIVCTLTALNQAEIDTALITNNIMIILASVLIAFAISYGFASRDILGNILSSFYGKDRFKQGQRIKIDGEEGIILKIDSIAVTIKTNDGRKLVIPCKKLITEKIEVLESDLSEN